MVIAVAGEGFAQSSDLAGSRGGGSFGDFDTKSTEQLAQATRQDQIDPEVDCADGREKLHEARSNTFRVDDSSMAIFARILRNGGFGPRWILLARKEERVKVSAVFQIIFNEISAAEISQLPTMMQLEVLSEFQVTPEDLENLDGDRFGSLEREGKKLFRYRAKDVRIYFEVTDDHSVLVHRVLTKNTFQDFLYRANLPLSEDEALSESKQFWKLIEEGENAKRV